MSAVVCGQSLQRIADRVRGIGMAKILVVDDEKLIVKGIRFSLEQEGMEVDCAYDGEEAIELARKTEYDMVLLDVMLPKHDGYEVCQAIREFSDMPIIMLTAKGGDMDKILGLEYGADDYISKPFNILEVKARIKAIMRRSGKNRKNRKEEQNSHVIGAGDLKMDTERSTSPPRNSTFWSFWCATPTRCTAARRC